MKRIAFYGGSFDPPHNGHLTIARELTKRFSLDEFVFVPAFHAPHKKHRKPTSAFHRFAMLALATATDARIAVSTIELDLPERPYSIETLTRLKSELPDERLFFVIGADSWEDIATWREWERVLTIVNVIVVTRPGFDIRFDHVSDLVRERITDLRGTNHRNFGEIIDDNAADRIYITDAVNIQVSATEIRAAIVDDTKRWRDDVPAEVAKYIEKYELYK